MGLLSKLKNAVTGGAAQVSINYDDPTIGEEFEVAVTANIADDEVNIARVYVQIEGYEVVEVNNVPVVERRGDDLVETSRTVSEREQTYEREFVLANAETLDANETYEWHGSLVIPEGSFPTFVGRNARHEWRIRAGLDLRGNDPDSGWQVLHVS